jgi:tetratricopeptide (TPR) repeat protein
MTPDDRIDNKNSDRSKLLEEIRRRAEEAELKRIEEEERERKPGASQKRPATQSPPIQKAPASTKPPEEGAGKPEPPPSQKAPAPRSAATKPESQKAPAAQPTAARPAASRAEQPPSQKAAPVPPPSQKAPAGPPPSQKATAAPPPSQKVPAVPPTPPQPVAKAPFPFPTPSGEIVFSPAKAARDQRITVLRERLIIALDRGKSTKAAELLAELSTMLDDQQELERYRIRLLEFQQKKESAKEKEKEKEKRPVSEVKPKEPPQEDRAQREARKKHIAELLETADGLYQGEKYERGLQTIEEIVTLDPSNEEAIRLRDQIQKAQDLAFKIQQEEARRKAEDAATYVPPPAKEQPKFKADENPWGTTTVTVGDVGYELPPEEKGPVGPPKRPTIEVWLERLSEVKVPVKPLVTAGIVLVATITAYFVIDSIRSTAEPPKYSLLVLPASPLSGDTAFTWIADGITEDLIRDFTAVNELRVIGAGTALGFRNTPVPPAQSARAVGANFYLQWSILRAATGVTVQPNFFDTLSPRPIWVSQYQTSLRELPGIRLELVHKLAGAMKVKINDEEEAAFRRYKVPDPGAYDYYLRARHMLRQRAQFDIASVIQTLEQSTEADSSFADAQSALGWAHILAYEAAPEVVTSHLAQASVCVQNAVSLGARNSEIFRVWGLIEQYRSQYDKAVERLEQAVTISPTDAESQRRLAVAYVVKNRADAALKAVQRAVTDDPGNLEMYTTLGLVQQFRADYRAALKAYEQGLRYARDRSEYASGFYADVLVYLQQPERAADVLNDRLARNRQSAVDYYKLGRIEQYAGKPKQEWHDVFLKAKTSVSDRLSAEPRDAVSLSFMALVHTRLGEFKDAIAANTRAQQLAPNDIEVLYNTARMYALQREKKQAFEYLTKAVNRRYSLASILDMDFFNLRSEPEFIAAIAR